MAKKKETKPLLATKFDFVESLDHLIQEIVYLHQCVEVALENNLIAAPVKDKLADAHKRVHAALFTKD